MKSAGGAGKEKKVVVAAAAAAAPGKLERGKVSIHPSGNIR